MKNNSFFFTSNKKKIFFLFIFNFVPVCLIFMNACSFSPSAISIFLMDRSYRQKLLCFVLFFEFFALTSPFFSPSSPVFLAWHNNWISFTKGLFRILFWRREWRKMRNSFNFFLFHALQQPVSNKQTRSKRKINVEKRERMRRRE